MSKKSATPQPMPAEIIPCPQCAQPINIARHGPSIHCDSCQNTFVLMSHTCPNCYHYHETETAVCQKCGEVIIRACRHCHTPNWQGDEQCQQCGESLDIFESMVTHTKDATSERLHQQMSDAQAFKKIEAASSEKRMAELQEIENERLRALKERQRKTAQKERTMLFITFGIIAVLLIMLLIYVFIF